MLKNIFDISSTFQYSNFFKHRREEDVVGSANKVWAFLLWKYWIRNDRSISGREMWGGIYLFGKGWMKKKRWKKYKQIPWMFQFFFLLIQSVPGILTFRYELVSCRKFVDAILFWVIYKTLYLTWGASCPRCDFVLVPWFFWVINSWIVFSKPK